MKQPNLFTKICFGILLVLLVKNVVINALMIGEMKDAGQGMYDLAPGAVPVMIPWSAPGISMPMDGQTPIPATNSYSIPLPDTPAPPISEPPKKRNSNPYSSD